MGLIRDMVASSRYRPLQPLVATETVVDDPAGRFRFEVPWPWFVADDEASGTGTVASTPVRLAAPRTSGDWPTIEVTTTTERMVIDDTQLRQLARAMGRANGGKSRAPRRLLVDGATAVDLAVERSDSVFHRVLMAPGELTVTLEFACPRSHAPGYEAHLDTLLSTWNWS